MSEASPDLIVDVLALGTEVLIDREIPATIRGITIYNEHWVKYLVIWWDERKRYEEWLTRGEFTTKGEAKSTAVRFR